MRHWPRAAQVTGVIPEFLTRREVAHAAITELIVTNSMHSRKQRMFEASDAFISLPGGLGTLDETIEIITWRQLRLHDKPILICDVTGSAAPFLATIEAAIAADFAIPGRASSTRSWTAFRPRCGAWRTCTGRRGARRRDCSGALSGAPRGYMRRLGRSVAQPGRALCSGRRGRRFEILSLRPMISKVAGRAARRLWCGRTQAPEVMHLSGQARTYAGASR